MYSRRVSRAQSTFGNTVDRLFMHVPAPRPMSRPASRIPHFVQLCPVWIGPTVILYLIYAVHVRATREDGTEEGEQRA